MKALTAEELLQIWEESIDRSPEEKTIRLLSRVYEVSDPGLISRLSIGDRDACLLHIREKIFGSRLQNTVRCPVCETAAEWETLSEDLHLQPVRNDLTVRIFNLEQDGYEIQYRLPDTNDLSGTPDMILSACILGTKKNGAGCDPGELPETLWEALNDRMAKEDPQADIRISLHCPVCAYEWEARFDIIHFFWTEINNWARRVMREVIQLSHTLGWSEKDILNMSARRRNLYLEMLKN